MKILIYSPSFYPKIGGLETIITTLAQEFFVAGHEVKLISTTPFTGEEPFDFEIIRCPKPQKTLRLIRWCDVFFQGCISLKGLWSLFFIPRLLVAAHHTWYRRPNGSRSWQDHLKCFVARFATNISISQAIAEQLPVASTIIPNSYRDDLFYELSDGDRPKELVFLGRLVSDKGVDLLLHALANLKEQGLVPNLTVIGDGPESERLKQQTIILGISGQVQFTGVKTGTELTHLLNKHQIMVVPSLWNEPFGIVALEGIACGCVVVGSEGGGLKEAIGDCGITFPNGDTITLTQALKQLLTQPHLLEQYRANAKGHLKKYQKATVATAYLQVLEKAVSGRI
jgi:glycosyltransferase involved in cell wall biosynthesis